MRAIDKDGERGRRRREQEGRRGDQKVFTYGGLRKKWRWGGKRWTCARMEGRTDASLTDLLTISEGGTSVTLTQRHLCRRSFQQMKSPQQLSLQNTVRFRAKFEGKGSSSYVKHTFLSLTSSTSAINPAFVSS